MNLPLVVIIVVLAATLLFFSVRSRPGRRTVRWVQSFYGFRATEAAEARAESLLRSSLTPEEYEALQQEGYLPIASRLYPDRVYHIPRERRRVSVYQIMPNHPKPYYRKLGELCLIPCIQVPDADVVLTHKWLLEADERTYLATANWIASMYP